MHEQNALGVSRERGRDTSSLESEDGYVGGGTGQLGIQPGAQCIWWGSIKVAKCDWLNIPSLGLLLSPQGLGWSL